MREIKYLVVHCTDSPDDRANVDAAEIHRWHVERGWSGIGYNAVVTRDEQLQQGRPDYWQGAHVRDFDENGEGDNSDSLGIVLVGRNYYTPGMMRLLEGWLRAKKAQHSKAEVVGHNELDTRKSCPNFNVREWWASRVDID